MAATTTGVAPPSGDSFAQTMGSLPPTLELLTYYRRRIEEFEAERAEFLARFKAVEETGEEIHRYRCELKVREQEVAELQKALSDANVFLYEEREQILKLQAENDALKIQEIEDRRRIQHLLALTQPVTQEVTFFRDYRPEKMTRYPAASETLASRDTSGGGGGSGMQARRVAGGGGASARIDGHAPSTPPPPPGAASPGSADGQHSRVLRTVYLPSERADALLLTTQSLQQQLDDMRKFMSDRTEAWRKDRQERESFHQRRHDSDAAQTAALEKDLEKTKAKLKSVTEDYLNLRHDAQASQRQLRETAAALQAANTKLLQEVTNVRSMSEQEVEHIKTSAKREGLHFKEYTRQQAQQREDDLRLLKEQYAEVQALYEARVKAVEAKLDALKERHKALQRRRNLELEGFTNDISSLRRTILSFESQWATLSESMLHHVRGHHTFSSTSGSEAGDSSADVSSPHSTSGGSDPIKRRVKSSGYGSSSGLNTSASSLELHRRRQRASSSISAKAKEPVPRRRGLSSSNGGSGGRVGVWPPAHHTTPAHASHQSKSHHRHEPTATSTSFSFRNSLTDKLQHELDRAVQDIATLRDRMSSSLAAET